ncbi:hypothetical protein HRI_000271900 [Hibiscus trionum]|uniref:Uncharacterized protein n=1 Tax=Hibiscus trionum TaxID=183268 RepID=A0A9W7GXU4_HIBTR|nr:hypothetical protein HRI_000271900 [Hibiscus trionum]
MGTATSTARHRRLQMNIDKDMSCSSIDFVGSSDSLGLNWGGKWQQSKEIEEQNASTNISETRIEVDSQHPIPFSTLEPAITSGGCSGSRNGTGPFISVQDQEVLNWTSESESLTKFGMGLSDSASSKPAGETNRKLLTTTTKV